MAIDNIDKLLNNTDHPVVERYLIAFIGYPDDIESATRDTLLKATLTLDIDLNIRLHRLGVEFFDDEGELIPTPDDWKAQELLGFESTYQAVTLKQIIADIDAYNKNPSEWPTTSAPCLYCGLPLTTHPYLYCYSCRQWISK